MRSAAELSDINIFFNYGSLDLELETEHDIFLGLLQGRNSLFYNRRDGAGISSYENYPSALWLQVMLKFEVMAWNAYRNVNTGNGLDGTKDRRVAMSQDYMKIENVENGAINFDIYYIPFSDYRNAKQLSSPIGTLTR